MIQHPPATSAQRRLRRGDQCLNACYLLEGCRPKPRPQHQQPHPNNFGRSDWDGQRCTHPCCQSRHGAGTGPPTCTHGRAEVQPRREDSNNREGRRDGKPDPPPHPERSQTLYVGPKLINPPAPHRALWRMHGDTTTNKTPRLPPQTVSAPGALPEGCPAEGGS